MSLMFTRTKLLELCASSKELLSSAMGRENAGLVRARLFEI